MSTMMRLALPMLAAASTAYAACSVSATTTIQNSGDASALASCTTFSGSIAIATQASGDITINGVKKITGNLVAIEANNLTSISGDSLESLDGDFELTTNTQLNSISFPKLSTVGQLLWVSVSTLSNVATQIIKADSVRIENTELQDLTGINLETVGDITIVNNRFITALEMQLTNITGSLILNGNSPELTVKLPNLESANNITIQTTSLLEIPALATLGDSLVLRQNTFESLAAPNLTKVGNSIVVVDNTQLTNASFPILTAISRALQIANNTQLGKIDGLPELKTIGANLDLHGNFSEVSLPALTDVEGSFNIQSTGDIQETCDTKFKPMSVNGGTGRIQGEYTCEGSVSNPGGEGTTPSKTGSGASKTNAASPLNVQNYGALSFAGLAAALFF